MLLKISQIRDLFSMLLYICLERTRLIFTNQLLMRCAIYTKNKSVIESWARGQKATGSNLRTDGTALWSYDLIIGYRTPSHSTIYNYRGSNSVSKTTARHVGQAIKHTKETMAFDVTDVLDPHKKY